MAGQAGKPLTLASTRSPTFHCRRAAAAAAALLEPFLRLGAIGLENLTQLKSNRVGQTDSQHNNEEEEEEDSRFTPKQPLELSGSTHCTEFREWIPRH